MPEPERKGSLFVVECKRFSGMKRRPRIMWAVATRDSMGYCERTSLSIPENEIRSFLEIIIKKNVLHVVVNQTCEYEM